MTNGHEQNPQPSSFTLKEKVLGNAGTVLWNWLFPRNKMAKKSRKGEHEVTQLSSDYYKSLLEKNLGMVNHLTNQIEGKWKQIENGIYGTSEYVYEENKYGATICDKSRQVKFFQSPSLKNTLRDEAKLFSITGTVNTSDYNVGTLSMRKINPVGRPICMPHLGTEEVVALGNQNFNAVHAAINKIAAGMSQVLGTAGSGFDANVRGYILKLASDITDDLKHVHKAEQEYGAELAEIATELQNLEDAVSEKGMFQNRPPVDNIRFPHTYKIINPKAVDKRTGAEKVFENDFGPGSPRGNFARTDEIAPGLDENGYPLEVFEYPDHSGDYYVLVDKWWEELSWNKWHEETIKDKPVGKKKWENKVEAVDINPGPYATSLKIGDFTYRTIRKVPDSDFVEDLDPLDKLCFMSNEWDSYRDDYRDGRWHKHSKTSMCYILEREVTPQTPIKFDINTRSQNVRIEFKPIYFTNGPNRGKLNPEGGMGRITSRNIPYDERNVSRIYDMETSWKVPNPSNNREQAKRPQTLLHQVRRPTHLNPAFDRAALKHDFIHWGRMFYYEGVEGINKWSENPFPHIATRGIAKYIIDLVLRSTLSFSDARKILKPGEGYPGFDYGIRHYDPPFTYDPLGPAEGPGGALYHGKVKAEEAARSR